MTIHHLHTSHFFAFTKACGKALADARLGRQRHIFIWRRLLAVCVDEPHCLNLSSDPVVPCLVTTYGFDKHGQINYVLSDGRSACQSGVVRPNTRLGCICRGDTASPMPWIGLT